MRERRPRRMEIEFYVSGGKVYVEEAKVHALFSRMRDLADDRIMSGADTTEADMKFVDFVTAYERQRKAVETFKNIE